MNHARPKAQHNRDAKRGIGRSLALLAPLAAAAVLLTGCPDDVQKEFRAAAGASLEAGVDAILDGFVDGIFAVLEPEEESAGDNGG